MPCDQSGRRDGEDAVGPVRSRSEQRTFLEQDPSARRAFDYYPTPDWMTRALLRRVSVFDVLEPCSGQDAIANALIARGRER